MRSLYEPTEEGEISLIDMLKLIAGLFLEQVSFFFKPNQTIPIQFRASSIFYSRKIIHIYPNNSAGTVNCP